MMKSFFLYKAKENKKTFDIKPSEKPKPAEPMGNVSSIISQNKKSVENILSVPKNGDIIVREFELNAENSKISAFIVNVDGLSDSSSVNDLILRPLMRHRVSKDNLKNDIMLSLLTQSQVSEETDVERAANSVNFGNTVLFADTLDCAFVIDTKGWEHRNIANPENEAVIQGPHEGFNEMLRCNTALIRKTLNTSNLIMENVTVGNTSKTPGAIAYIRNVTNDSLVNEVRRRILSIDAEYVMSSLDVEQYIEEESFLPIPQMITTERTDRVCRALTEGRVVFILNGSPHALIMPATFFDLVTSAEDEYLRYPYSLLIRVLRYLAVFIALLFPGVFASLLNYHPELLLTNILLAVSSSRALVPFGVFTELILMEVAFELIKEAGIRVPGPIGSTLGIVGGLIIGQSAVEANLVSPIMIIIVAVTGIASFTVPSYSLSFSFRFSRFLYILGGAFFGLFGVSAVFFVNTLMSIGVKSFGVPFLSPLSPVGNINKTELIFGLPVWKRGTMREDYLHPKDMQKKAKQSRKWRDNFGKDGE